MKFKVFGETYKMQESAEKHGWSIGQFSESTQMSVTHEPVEVPAGVESRVYAAIPGLWEEGVYVDILDNALLEASKTAPKIATVEPLHEVSFVKRPEAPAPAKAEVPKVEAPKVVEAAPSATKVEDDKDKKPIEAYGAKGMKSKPWRKTFKNQAHLAKWTEKHDAKVHAYARDENISRIMGKSIQA